MCVIALIEDAAKRPNEEMIDAMWNSNRDGGGIAWQTKDNKGNKVVAFKKGIEKVEEMKRLCATVPVPYVAHFRVASVGGVRPSLTHPFLIDKTMPIVLAGKVQGPVLFHNGHWSDWDKECRQAAYQSKVPLPTGKWSDTRAMAWLCSIYGPGFMELFPDQKGVLMTPDDIEVFTGRGWVKVEEIWCSNDIFHTRGNNIHAMCRFATCTSRDSFYQGYCWDHQGGRVRPTLGSGTTQHNTGTNTMTKDEKPKAGGTSAASPFRQATGTQTLVTVKLAEQMHQQTDTEGRRMLSKKKLKKITKLYEVLAHPNSSKRVSKAREELLKITLSLPSLSVVH